MPQGGALFPRFSSLPPELRNKIWHHALREDVQLAMYPYEDGCWVPRYLSQSDPEYDQMNPAANLAFEFRFDLLAEAKIDVPMAFANTEAHGIAVTWALEHGLHVCGRGDGHGLGFLRAFDPDRDALYVTPSNWNDMLQEPVDRLFAPDLVGREIDHRPTLKRIAMPESLIRTRSSELLELFNDYYDLRTLYIVLDAPPDSGSSPRGNLSSHHHLLECGNLSKVASWTFDYEWAYDFTQISYGDELRTLVDRACRGLREGLIMMSVRDFEIYSVSVVRT
ncbi:hypothetical protein F5Y18DRAFT_367858 [Xylariaceae sp. FL1019]|nr:hypothetical protein F5Y18DRAFT_367858 [Xylariaceae sp. FL1019]